MKAQRMQAQLFDEIPVINILKEQTKSDLRKLAKHAHIPKGSIIFRPGDKSEQFPFIASGSIRVQRITENGREIVLYRVSANETCILTTASLISGETYSAEAIAETDVVAYLLTDSAFRDLLNRYEDFRTLVFNSYSHRISELMMKVEEIVCVGIDIRLAQRLLEIADEKGLVRATQSALAADLATAREVVGRSLKVFLQSGWVTLSRGEIEIKNIQALKNIIKNAS
jgi:CRP/FNR family transcriptional regulator